MFRHLRRIFAMASDRVKAVDFHPTDALLAASLYNGSVVIFSTTDLAVLRTLLVDKGKPVRCVRWIPHRCWVIAASDSLVVSCFDCSTGSAIASQANAHSDFVRQIAVHPTRLQFLSCSDDSEIILSSIENSSLTIVRSFEGHDNSVMDVKFDPRDDGIFASASLDGSIKFWNLESSTAKFTLCGHSAGVNCLDFFPGRDKPLLASGSDDFTIKVWDYQAKSCVITLPGHTANVTAIRIHPTYPLLLSTAEDDLLIVWSSLTFRQETTLNYQKKRGWCIDCNGGLAAVGYDDGLVVLKVGHENPTSVAIDLNGRAFWAKGPQILSANLSHSSSDSEAVDVAPKDIDTLEFCASSIAYNSTGKFVAVTGDGQYSIFSALAWRVRAFGEARELAWGIGDTYAIRLNSFELRVVTRFSESAAFEPPYDCTRVFGGACIGIVGDSAVTFLAWDDRAVLRCIDIGPRFLLWSPTAPLVALVTATAVHVLEFNAESNAFALLATEDRAVRSAVWFNDILFMSDDRTIVFLAGEHFEVAARPERALTLVGYLPRSGRLFACDAESHFFQFSVPTCVLAFVVSAREDANTDTAVIPLAWRARMSGFLEGLGNFAGARALADDTERRFDLDLKMADIGAAVEIARVTQSADQFRRLVGPALRAGRVPVLEEALAGCGDDAGLLLLAACKGAVGAMAEIAAHTENRNVAFSAAFAAGDYEQCIAILLAERRAPEAAMMARAYAPALAEKCAIVWREMLRESGRTEQAEAIALPSESPELFRVNRGD
jgi:coatomer subunit beta'